MERTARIDGPHRYWLSRQWSRGGKKEIAAGFVMLNPSTADAEQDDPTIETCIRFAKAWSCSGLYVVNLFTVRSPDPRTLRKKAAAGEELNGPEADTYIRYAVDMSAQAGAILVAAWGAFRPNSAFEAIKRDRIAVLTEYADQQGVGLWCVGISKDGSPEHPLYHSPRKNPIRPWRATL